MNNEKVAMDMYGKEYDMLNSEEKAEVDAVVSKKNKKEVKKGGNYKKYNVREEEYTAPSGEEK